ncbi:hypothetical protein PLICRDRAFT_433652 [Plicaturopsis crispa FD-325 SS-3]|uniref:Uncharacterized protein n=1 Tax=Plicaturopsis crispa FD-325 SS-3 TaxID=944288 RepID=A0A0C9SKM0_PLICR|nr:hypothetical protein PLICRDRAFT_433652 [Plicaturopsis crispa FD-325 SS-3]
MPPLEEHSEDTNRYADAPTENGSSDAGTSTLRDRSRSLQGRISAIGAKIGRALSNDSSSSQNDGHSDRASLVSATTTLVAQPRGREALPKVRATFQSSGRGGAGNIHASTSPQESDATVPNRGREAQPSANAITISDSPPRIVSTGRGGTGNIRRPSREAQEARLGSLPTVPSSDVAEFERRVLERNEEAKSAAHSTGRGGVGNISSKSRSRSKSKLRS